MPNVAKIMCEMKKFTIQKLDLEQSFYKTAIYYSASIKTICSEIIVLLWIIITAKDILSNKKFFHTKT